ncbi:rod shape-determining protein MreC [Stakelama saccharophila]|uniref:Cell shape-determining protein MreC n=1 Tax=Stakelama saccharophila TaxID=3075605 RepID=A0ABZ0B5F8_9SPHN|nr:rod shape-determining protein MreC [Stakelama sp. W311]WNO52437.1 rod shape-determining protein MreC [Stakelama sp. W311]
MATPRNRRPGFSRRAQYGLFLGYVLAGAGVFVAVILLLLSSFDPQAYGAVRGGLREVTTPVSSLFAGIRRGVSSIPASISDHFRTVSENRNLKQQLASLRTDVIEAQSLERENARLRRLLALRDRATRTVVAARLVSSSASSTRRYAILDAGRRQGVRASQPVRGPRGLIGRVLEAGPNSARVMLVLDPESIVPVRRVRDGLPAIIVGRGDGMVDVRAASIANAPFLAGDIFVTSGTGGIYPPDIPVARVARNARDTAVARVFASPDSSDFALVLDIFMPPSQSSPGTETDDQP